MEASHPPDEIGAGVIGPLRAQFAWLAAFDGFDQPDQVRLLKATNTVTPDARLLSVRELSAVVGSPGFADGQLAAIAFAAG